MATSRQSGYPSAIPVLSSWEAYINTNPSGDLNGFARWLIEREVKIRPQAPAAASASAQSGQDPAQASPTCQPAPGRRLSHGALSLSAATELDVTAQCTLLIARLNRILRVLSKTVVKQLGFPKDIEYGVLVQIAIMDKPNKKELCREMLIEGSTGVEITKRLAKRGYLLEKADERDRRSARLSLTEKGKRALQQGYEKLGMIHQDFLEGLSPEQKEGLADLLALVNDFQTRKLNAMEQAGTGE